MYSNKVMALKTPSYVRLLQMTAKSLKISSAHMKNIAEMLMSPLERMSTLEA